MTDAELRRRLDAVVGLKDKPSVGRDPVNEPMIRHWCDAVGDRNPVYTDPEFAGRSVHGGIVAPPTMVQAWIMLGLVPEEQRHGGGPLRDVMNLLDEAGYTSVVATNCQQEYRRYLKPGDRITISSQVDSISDEKQTALGAGRFVDQLMVYTDQRGDEVARQRWRILKFKPRQRAQAANPGAAAQAAPIPAARAPRRPRPSVSTDNAFFWEGVAQRELRIQRCSECKRLRHPPGPMCPHCHSLDWDHVVASGRGKVFSYVLAHHPPVPPFEYPHLVVLVELDEGTRLISHLVAAGTEHARIGQPVQVAFTEVEPGLVLPLFRPAA
jgi:uncharacterized OB-fold protein/acyl dehydratase